MPEVVLVSWRLALNVTAWGELEKHLNTAEVMWFEVRRHEGHSLLTLVTRADMMLLAFVLPLLFCIHNNNKYKIT